MTDRFMCLVRIQSAGGSRSQLVGKPEFTIGRSSEADLPFPFPSVSRLHVKVVLTEHGPMITDLGSANGTKVGDQVLPPQHPFVLQPGDKVYLGQIDETLSFELISVPLEFQNPDQAREVLKESIASVQSFYEEEARKTWTVEHAQLIQKWNLEYDELKRMALREIDILKEKSQREAQALVNKAQQAAQEKQKLLHDELEEKKRHQERQILEQQTEFQANQTKKRMALEVEQEKQLKLVQSEIEEKRRRVSVEVSGALEKARDQASAILSDVDKKAEEIMREAREKSAAILSQAQSESQVIKDLAQRQAEEIQQSAKNSLDGLIKAQTQANEARIQQLHEQAAREIDQAKALQISQAREQAESAQLEIVQKYKNQIDDLKQKTEQLTFQRTELQEAIENFTSENQVYLTKIEEHKKLILILSSEVKSLETSKSQVEKIIGQRDAVGKEIEQFLSKKESLIQQIEDLEKKMALAKASVESEIQKAKEKSLMEHQELKIQLESELTRKRLDAMNSLKNEIEVEEQKLKEVRKNQSTELARDLELKLLPPLLKQGVPAGFDPRKILYDSVIEVMGRAETSLKADTQFLGTSPEVVQKQKERKFRNSVVAASLVLVSVGYWQKEWLRQTVLGLGGPSFASLLMEERKQAAIYRPKMDLRFKSTYMENVLYMKGYLEAKIESAYTEKWTLELNNLELMRSLGLNEEAAVQFIAKEYSLVQQLGTLRASLDANYLEQGLGRMRDAEREAMQEMIQILGSEQNFKKIRKLERASVEKFLSQRGLATDEHSETSTEPAQD